MRRFGLTCISEILKDRDKSTKYRFKKLQKTKYRSLGRKEGLHILSSTILHNIDVIENILNHCNELGIRHYRIPNFIPLVSDESLDIQLSDLPDYTNIKTRLLEIGKLCLSLDITVSMHPSQFVVLSSTRADVVVRSQKELHLHAAILDLMGFPKNHSNPITLHLSKGLESGETVEQYGERFVSAFKECSDSVQQRLVLENEDKGYWNCFNLLAFHDHLVKQYQISIPLVFDNLHHSVNHTKEDSLVETTFRAIHWLHEFVKTWDSHIPVMHWSAGKTSMTDRRHHDYITKEAGMPYVHYKDITWEIEVKAKDYAISNIIKRKLHDE